jgi:hypothetical protein
MKAKIKKKAVGVFNKKIDSSGGFKSIWLKNMLKWRPVITPKIKRWIKKNEK